MALTTPPPMSSDPISEGSHQAIITQLVDKGHQRGKEYGTDREIVQHQLHVCFELPHELDVKDRRRQISQTYNMSTGSKSNLRKLIHAAMGKSLTDEEVARLDLRSLLGKNVTISVEHYKKSMGGVGAKVRSANALTRGLPSVSPEGKLLVYEVESGDPPADLPDWLRKTINESLERKGEPVPGSGGDEGETIEPPPKPLPPVKSFDEFDGSEETPSEEPPPVESPPSGKKSRKKN